MDRHQILERVRIKIPVKTYETPHTIHGDIPKSLAGRLPLFASEDGNQQYFNSGGRGILVTNGDSAYRIKGADPKGVVVRKVAESTKNIIADIREAAKTTPDPDSVESILQPQAIVVQVPGYRERRPWNFLTAANVENSRRASEVLGEAYDKLGLKVPCRHIAAIEYPTLSHETEPLYSEILGLPDLESDLRQDEFEVLMRRRLQHASGRELRALKDDVIKLYEAFIRWHAFECRVMADAGLVPFSTSFLGQNYVISHVGEGQVCLARVDNTSTTESTDQDRINESAKQFTSLLLSFPSFVVQATEMCDKSMPYDSERFSCPFDAAFKTCGELRPDIYPKTLRQIKKSSGAFEEDFKNPKPEPVSEELMLKVFDQAMSIEIDEEFEARRRAKYEELRASGMLKSLGIE